MLFGCGFGCAPSPNVTVAEGGTVSSADGAFRIFFPPGAVAEDTVVSIDVLPEAEWPVDAPGRFVRIGDVYRVTPRQALVEDAYAIIELDAVPDALRSPSGRVLAVHYVYDGERVRPAPATRTTYFADGRVALVGTLFDLGDQWFGERVPGPDRSIMQVTARLDAEAGAHSPDSEWRWRQAGLYAENPVMILGTDVRATVVPSGETTLAPLLDMGTERTWDARWDESLGLHPTQLFGGSPEPRTETLVTHRDPIPYVLTETTPRDTLTDPLPGWSCGAASAGDATLFGGVDIVTGASTGTLTAGVVVEFGAASCQ